LLISHCFPPVPIGPSFILERLLTHFPEDSYVVYTNRPNVVYDRTMRKLPCRYYYASAQNIYGRRYSRWSLIREWLEVLPMVWKGLKIISRKSIQALLVLPGSDPGNFLLAAFIMHKIKRTPLFLYLFDCFSEAQVGSVRTILSRFIEKIVIKASVNVFVMSEKLKEYYDDKYSINTILLPHAIDISKYKKFKVKALSKRQTCKKIIVFTGVINELNIDVLRNVVIAIEQLQDVEFHTYSRVSKDKLVNMKIVGNNVFHHGFISHDEIYKIQMQANILILPMTFNCIFPHIVKTASPGKLPEYLASGCPILVHAPKDAYITWYAKNKGWGGVVDKYDTDLLRKELLKMLEDKSYCNQLVTNAKETLILHNSKIVANKLLNTIYQQN